MKLIITLCILVLYIDLALQAPPPTVDIQIYASSVNPSDDVTSVNPGDDVIVRCRLNNSRLGDFVTWKKIQHKQESTIGANFYLSDNFVKSGRYSVVFESQGSTLIFTMTINDTRVEDSGYIGCAPPGGEPIYKLLQVIVPVQELKLYSMTSLGALRNHSDSEVVNFDLGDSVVFGCVASGSFPRATLTTTMGDENITTFFKEEHEVLMLDDPLSSQGLVRMLHMTILENKERPLVMSREYKNAEFACRADLPSQQPIETKISINISFAPHINCTHVKAPKHASDVTLSCHVDSHPSVTHVHWSWLDASGNKTLLPGQKMNVFSASGLLEGKHTLHVSRVDEDLFGVYKLTASNPLGETTAEVHLQRDFAAESGSYRVVTSWTLLTIVFVISKL